MKWFRHFSNASTSLKLNGLIDKLGLKGYGQYWLLIELLNDKFDGLDASSIMVHQSELLTSLRLRYVGGLGELLGNMKGLELFDYTRNERVYSFNCPILFELMDKDSRFNKKRDRKSVVAYDQVANNRYKNKEVDKEVDNTTPTPSDNFDPTKFLDAKKILPKATPLVHPKITPDEIIDAWNKSMGMEFGTAVGLGGGKHLTNCLESIKYLPTIDSWIDLFSKCRNSEFLTGKGTSTWTVNLLWLIDYDNALKVLNGNFDDGKAIKAMIAGMKSVGESA